MAISGTSCSTYSSSSVSVTDTNKLRQDEKSQQLDVNDNNSSNNEPAEFIFRGELLEDAVLNNDFNGSREQTIDPANQSAINHYETNSHTSNEPLILQRQGAILDAYA